MGKESVRRALTIFESLLKRPAGLRGLSQVQQRAAVQEIGCIKDQAFKMGTTYDL